MGASGWAQKAFAIAKTLNNADLLVALAELKSDYADRVTEIAELKQRIRTLEDRLSAGITMLFRENVYWRQIEGSGEEGPYCPKCWDGERKPVRMLQREDDFRWWCSVCVLAIQRPGMEPPEPPEPRQSDWLRSRY